MEQCLPCTQPGVLPKLNGKQRKPMLNILWRKDQDLTKASQSCIWIWHLWIQYNWTKLSVLNKIVNYVEKSGVSGSFCSHLTIGVAQAQNICSVTKWVSTDLLKQSVSECDEYIRIFEYLNIRIYWSQIYIQTFVRINFSFTNIFGHSLVSVLECKT